MRKIRSYNKKIIQVMLEKEKTVLYTVYPSKATMED